MSALSEAILRERESGGNRVGTYSLRLRCPKCQKEEFRSSGLESVSQFVCAACGFGMRKEKGILRALHPDREVYFRQFVGEYETVRAREGRGSISAAYYLALPDRDMTGRNGWQWEIRARTFRCLERQVLRGIEYAHPVGCDVLDLGAGNCWFSYRMALRGHRPVAVDLLDNDMDGLGAAKHYFPGLSAPFQRFVAEMDRLPFATGQFDIVVFNASFHYSVDYLPTLTEALRCLRRPGIVVIADSPLYSREESGREMLAEKRAAFQRQFGFRSDSIPSVEYLTPAALKKLEEQLPVRWKIVTPWYGLQWALRPWKARFQRRREPSRFQLIWSEVLE